jgi:hypothetical protein
MASVRDWERKAFAATLAFVAISVYALRFHATFTDYASAVEWILGIYITGQAAQQVGFAKFGLLASEPKKKLEKTEKDAP